MTTDPLWRGHAWISSVGLGTTGPISLVLSQKGRGYSQGSAVTGTGSCCCCCISKSKELKPKKFFSPLLIGFGLSLVNSLPLVPFAPMGGSDCTFPNWPALEVMKSDWTVVSVESHHPPSFILKKNRCILNTLEMTLSSRWTHCHCCYNLHMRRLKCSLIVCQVRKTTSPDASAFLSFQ